MAPFAILADTVLTPLEALPDAVVLVEGSKIAAVGSRSEVQIPHAATRIEAKGKTLVPGFVDIHIHGAGGVDVMDANPEALQTIAATLARFGTTAFVPTTVTASLDTTIGAILRIAAFTRASRVQHSDDVTAESLGIHLEGPFISKVRRGVHPEEWVAAPSVNLFGRLIAPAMAEVRILTLAPELPGAFDLIVAARKQEIVVSMGHTDATYEQATAAIRHGAARG